MVLVTGLILCLTTPETMALNTHFGYLLSSSHLIVRAKVVEVIELPENLKKTDVIRYCMLDVSETFFGNPPGNKIKVVFFGKYETIGQVHLKAGTEYLVFLLKYRDGAFIANDPKFSCFEIRTDIGRDAYIVNDQFTYALPKELQKKRLLVENRPGKPPLSKGIYAVSLREFADYMKKIIH